MAETEAHGEEEVFDMMLVVEIEVPAKEDGVEMPVVEDKARDGVERCPEQRLALWRHGIS